MKGYLLALVVAIAALGVVGFAAAEDTEYVNEPIEFEENATLELEFVWNETVIDPDAEATVTFYNESEFNESGTDAPVILQDTVPAEENATTFESWNVGDVEELEAETEYRLIVEGDSNHLNDVRETSSIIAPPGFFDGDAGGPLVGLLVLGGVVVFAAMRRD